MLVNKDNTSYDTKMLPALILTSRCNGSVHFKSAHPPGNLSSCRSQRWDLSRKPLPGGGAFVNSCRSG